MFKLGHYRLLRHRCKVSCAPRPQGNVAGQRRLQLRVMLNLGQTRLLATFFAGLSLGAVLLAAPAQRKPQPKHPAPPKSAELSAPFHAAEAFEYRVQWSKLVNAASVQLAVTERRPFYGREAWHFRAQAHTIDPMRYLFVLDDQFDSYSELATLASLQFEMYLREQGKREDVILPMSAEGDLAPGTGAAVRVLPGTRDALGYLYYLRAVDWQQARETRSPVFDGKKLYEARARLDLDRAEVTVSAGSYAASRIEVRVYERGREVPQTHFWIWLAQDARRTPVLLEAEVPFGTARVELTRAQ
jgi:Protein of unknown function (DUF3108)